MRRFDDDVRDGYDTTREDAREFRQDARQDFDQFGRDALDLVEGRLAFAVKDGKLRMTRTD